MVSIVNTDKSVSLGLALGRSSAEKGSGAYLCAFGRGWEVDHGSISQAAARSAAAFREATTPSARARAIAASARAARPERMLFINLGEGDLAEVLESLGDEVLLRWEEAGASEAFRVNWPESDNLRMLALAAALQFAAKGGCELPRSVTLLDAANQEQFEVRLLEADEADGQEELSDSEIPF